jgi:hypothetical protein
VNRIKIKMKLKMDTVDMVIVFVLGCALILMMLPSSVEGVDETLSPPPPQTDDEPAAAGDDAANQKINELDARLSALEASVKESKDSIEDGEMKANAAIGNLQMTLPP